MEGLLKDMIDLFGGIRFRYINLCEADGMQLLLDACANTLETLVLRLTGPFSEQFPLNGMQDLTNDVSAGPSLRDFDLSQNKSLRTLEIPASSINRTKTVGLRDTTSFLRHALSTITSSAFCKIIVLYEDHDFHNITWHSDQPLLRELSQAEREEEASRHHMRFEVLREVHKVRGFQLALCASVPGPVGEYPVRMLEEAVAEEKAKRGFDTIFSEPSVMYNPLTVEKCISLLFDHTVKIT
jgi:hypothetical protein